MSLQPVRILHTADWQLGLMPGQFGEEVGERLRRLRFDTARRIADLARERRVALVILAGDTFDSPDLDRATFEQALLVLREFAPTPVALLPGNHDPDVPGGIWERVRAAALPGVLVLDRPAEVAVAEGLVLYPCPLGQRQARRDPTEWIPERRALDRRFRIGVAHGSLSTLAVASNWKIAAERAETSGLDYLALGDWHSRRIIGRCAYPGTPEPTGFDEDGAGAVLVVELAEGSAAAVETALVGQTRWLERGDPVDQPSALVRLRSGVEEWLHQTAALGAAGVLRLRVDLSAEGEGPALEEWLASLSSRVFHLDSRVERTPGMSIELDLPYAGELDRWLEQLPPDGEVCREVGGADTALTVLTVLAARRLLRRLAGAVGQLP